jgi:hypothetical protein
MRKILLSEQAIYCGDVKMPKDWEIDRNHLSGYILQSNIRDSEFLFSRTWDKLNTYLVEHIRLKYKINLVNKETWGNIYKPNETTKPLLNVDPVNLKYSPDYTLLYGVIVKDCNINIHYDDNRRKGRLWSIPLSNNGFVMFPSTNLYYLSNKQSNDLNFVQTITYEFI